MAMEFSGLPFVYKIDLCYASILVNLCLFYPVVSYQPRLWTRLLENALGSCSCSLLYIFFLELLLGTLEAGAVYDNLVVHSNVLVLTPSNKVGASAPSLSCPCHIRSRLHSRFCCSIAPKSTIRTTRSRGGTLFQRCLCLLRTRSLAVALCAYLSRSGSFLSSPNSQATGSGGGLRFLQFGASGSRDRRRPPDPGSSALASASSGPGFGRRRGSRSAAFRLGEMLRPRLCLRAAAWFLCPRLSPRAR